jgi:hypothetical protein
MEEVEVAMRSCDKDVEVEEQQYGLKVLWTLEKRY